MIRQNKKKNQQHKPKTLTTRKLTELIIYFFRKDTDENVIPILKLDNQQESYRKRESLFCNLILHG